MAKPATPADPPSNDPPEDNPNDPRVDQCLTEIATLRTTLNDLSSKLATAPKSDPQLAVQATRLDKTRKSLAKAQQTLRELRRPLSDQGAGRRANPAAPDPPESKAVRRTPTGLEIF